MDSKKDVNAMISKMFNDLPAKERLKLKLKNARSDRLPHVKQIELRKSAEEEFANAMKVLEKQKESRPEGAV